MHASAGGMRDDGGTTRLGTPGRDAMDGSIACMHASAGGVRDNVGTVRFGTPEGDALAASIAHAPSRSSAPGSPASRTSVSNLCFRLCFELCFELCVKERYV